MYKRDKIEFIEIDKMNEHLQYCKKYRVIKVRQKETFESVGLNAYIEDKMVEFRLTYKRIDKPCTYICYKDGRPANQKITGQEAYRILNLYYNIPERQVNFSASPFLYKNDKYENKRVRAYSYDMNSAYSWAMLQDIPDTSVPPVAKVIEEGEIGFYLNGDIKTKGYSSFVFKLIPSPFEKFVNNWYKKKQSPKTKAKAKGVLNYCVGYLQRKNPFLRAYIVGLCNNLIKSLINENTLYCNTDSIVSLVPLDLKLGNNVGEWKIEKIGNFAFVGFNYQWDLDPPSYRSKPKTWFKKGWDILKDELPVEGNLYYYDNKKVRLYESKKEKVSI